MARAKQDEMFAQSKIAAIEKWADVFDEKRTLINGLTEEMANAEFKIGEAMRANAAKLDKQKGPKGEDLLVYERGDYKVVEKTPAHKILVKIKEASKGTEPDGDQPEPEDEE